MPNPISKTSETSCVNLQIPIQHQDSGKVGNVNFNILLLSQETFSENFVQICRFVTQQINNSFSAKLMWKAAYVDEIDSGSCQTRLHAILNGSGRPLQTWKQFRVTNFDEDKDVVWNNK